MTRMELADQIVEKGIATREAQRDYFTTRGNLQQCKQLEKELDVLHVLWRKGHGSEQENFL